MTPSLAQLDAVLHAAGSVHQLPTLTLAGWVVEARTALTELLADIADKDDDCWQMVRDSHCPDCTVGCVPNHLNRGPCAYHRATALLRTIDRHTTQPAPRAAKG